MGKTMREALENHRWSNATLVGCDDEGMNVALGARKGSPGLCGDPNRVILGSDHLVFVSASSTPRIGRFEDLSTDFASEAAPLLPAELGGAVPQDKSTERGVARRKSTANGSIKLERKNVLVCGWRMEWDAAPERVAGRFRDICSGLI